MIHFVYGEILYLLFLVIGKKRDVVNSYVKY